jgi:hypothetical protein
LNMPAICLLQSILGAKDFFHLMFSVLLLTSQMHLKSKIQCFSGIFMILISFYCFFT